jgi:hypothetical protein
MIRREEARLRSAFRLMLLTLAAPACSSATPEDPATDASVADTGAALDATNPSGEDSPSSSDAAKAPDMGTGTVTDAGTDAAAQGCSDAAPYPTDGKQDDAACDYFFRFPCGLPSTAKTSGCDLFLPSCAALCNPDPSTPAYPCKLVEGCDDAGVIAAGAVTLSCASCGGGRRPSGLEEEAFGCDGDGLGGWFARMAHLEAASIAAFRSLSAELNAHGAPPNLVRASRRSARDEVRHTRTTVRLAQRFGGKPRPARVRKTAPRSLEAMAIENAVEGCVRETFGALLALWQAAHAEDAEVKRAMKKIAADETRHAALAWSIAAWADARLDDAARARVQAARAEAVETLRVESGAIPARALVRVAGLPDADRARAMVDAMAATLLS